MLRTLRNRGGGMDNCGPVHHAGPMVEPLEERRLLAVDIVANDYVSVLDGFGLFGKVQLGDNGYEWGSPSLLLGSSSSYSTGTYEWDEFLEDGLDSGWRHVAFTAKISGTDQMYMQLGDGDAVYYSGNALSSIGSVSIRAAVTGPDMKMSWGGLSVTFLRNGSIVETFWLNDLVADTMGEWDFDGEEVIAMVTPTYNNCDEVVVNGAVRLQAEEGAWVGPSDIFGDILIYSA